MVRAFVVGNVVWDEALLLAALPAPGASVHVRRGSAGPGGKGANQAVVLARSGVPVTFVAPVGRDARGDALVAALAAEGLDGALVRVDAPTDWSAILVTEAGENAVLTTREAAEALGAEAIVAALEGARAGDLCLLQGNLPNAPTRAAIEAARARGMVLAMNPSPVDGWMGGLLDLLDIVAVNRTEAAALGHIGARQVVTTLGAEGARLGDDIVVPAIPARVVDPTAAGDTFLGAMLAHAAPRGWQLDEAALRAGVAAAALTVGRPGAFTALPTLEELAAIMSVR